MERHESVRRYESGLSMQDLDRFADLEWERSTSERSSSLAARKSTNLSAVVEDYLTTYF